MSDNDETPVPTTVPNHVPRALGWKKDRPSNLWHPDTPARLHLGTVAPPAEADLENFIARTLDQGSVSDCTCYAVAQAVHISQEQQGFKDAPYMAPFFNYFLARDYDHETAEDAGTYLRNVFMSLVKFGFCPESSWPQPDDAAERQLYAKQPSVTAFHDAYDQREPTEYLRIDTEGNERLLDIRRAIAAGHAVVFGTLVTNDFVSNVLPPGPLQPPTDMNDIAGGHALCLIGYKSAINNGSILHPDDEYKIKNSWSESFGVKGNCIFSGNYLTWDQTTDLWIVRKAPNFSQPTTPAVAA